MEAFSNKAGEKNDLANKAVKRYRRARRAIFFNILINLGLALFKGLVGYFSRSKAMVADAFHSGGDLLVNAVVLFGLRAARKPADKCHPYGHGRAETLAQNVVGLLILVTGGYLIITSLLSLREGVQEPPGSFALFAALISIVIKELLFRYMWALGKKENSRALMANAWDHRSDVLSSIAAAVGIGGARLGAYLGYPFLYYLDPLAGALVAVLIIYMGLEIMREAGNELMDGTCSPETLAEIKRIALEVPRVKEVHQIRARSSGPCLLVDLEIGVEKELTVEEGHEVAHHVEERLFDEREDIHSITVHVGPAEDKKT